MTDAAANPLSKVRPLYWSVRRELWETRSVYIAPAVAAVVVWCGYLLSAIGMPAREPCILGDAYMPPSQPSNTKVW